MGKSGGMRRIRATKGELNGVYQWCRPLSRERAYTPLIALWQLCLSAFSWFSLKSEVETEGQAGFWVGNGGVKP